MALPIQLTFNENRSEVYAEAVAGMPGKVKFSSDQLLSELTKQGVYDYKLDYGAIEIFCRQFNQGQSQRVLVGRRIDAKVSVDVAPDDMAAYISITPPQGGEPITRDKVLEALRNRGVTMGVNEAVIDNLIEQAWYDERVLVAEGILADHGQDSEVEYFFDVSEAKSGPKVNEDGSVDWRDLGLIKNVSEGHPLFRIQPATAGTPGYTVSGKTLDAKSGKDRPAPTGKGVRQSPDDPNLYVAEVSGMPRLSNRKVSVLNVYEVNGDVDFGTGNIQFAGDVVIKGSVKEGFSVQADGNITVSGIVEGATLTAGGDVLISKGMNGQRKGALKAGGNVMAKFLEQTEVEAGQDVIVAEAILHCDISAGRNVKVQSPKRGSITGGMVVATNEIFCKNLGSVASTKTEVEAGGNPKIRKELIEIQEQTEECKKKLERTEKSVKLLKETQKSDGSLPKEKRDLLLNLTRQQFQLMGEIRRLGMRREELQEVLESAVHGKVVVTGQVFPGVSIIVKQAIMKVTSELSSMTFVEKDGMVSYMPYSGRS